MKNYKGQYDKNGDTIDQPERGGQYVQENGEAHESCNFLPDKNGLVFGHVETWRGDDNTGYDTEIKIENLGADKGDSYINDVDVVWIATHEHGGKRVVGWYTNAIIYRARQSHEGEFPTEQHKRDNVHSYRIVAHQEDATLIKAIDRILLLDPNKNKAGWPGRSSVFYPQNHENNNDLKLFMNELKDLMNGNSSGRSAENGDNSYEEGGEKLSLHRRKERDRKLVNDFKNQLTDFSCSICGFNFEEIYGSIGEEFIEAHHTTPLSTLTEKSRVSINDLVGVCSNCHRMLHRTRNPISVKVLTDIVNSKN